MEEHKGTTLVNLIIIKFNFPGVLFLFMNSKNWTYVPVHKFWLKNLTKKSLFFYKQGERTCIRRQHRHPNQDDIPRDLHPMPSNSKKFIKKGRKYLQKEGGTRSKPSKITAKKTKKRNRGNNKITQKNRLRKSIVR